MKEETKAKAQTYAVGGVCGAIIILIAGFWVGPLTTNSALTTAVDAAVTEQQAQFCAERGRAAPAYVDAASFKALEYSEKNEFASRFGTFDGHTPSNSRKVTNACRAILETA